MAAIGARCSIMVRVKEVGGRLGFGLGVVGRARVKGKIRVSVWARIDWA